MSRYRNIIWTAIVMAVSIACSAIWPLGWAPSHGPVYEDCTATSTGLCAAPLGNDTSTI